MILEGVSEDRLYRVYIKSDTNTVEVSCIGMNRVDSLVDGTYDCVDDLPIWLQERLAVLMVTDWKPITVGVEGIGRRIDKTTYWVIHP